MRLNIQINTTHKETRAKYLQPLIGGYLTVALKDKTVYEGVNITHVDAPGGMCVLLLLLEKPAQTKVVRIHDIVKVEVH